MANIRILDEHTANQIAAGEVVERPFSVVKELVENSIDAGADRIVVDLEAGGLVAITVSDNGCGMVEEDLLLAFQRHATSKIRWASDLSRLITLGFRGEALPSIAAVSRVSVTSRAHGALTGARAEVQGGSPVATMPAGCPPGTTVVVRDLFFNTPARRKSMKTSAAEHSLCAELITRLAMARPAVSYELRVTGRRVFYTAGTGKLLDAVAAVYGVQLAREMIAFSAAAEGVLLEGYAGKPSVSRSARSHMTVIINGRYVNCSALTRAIEEAYYTLLPQGRRPVVVLALTIEPEQLDVNVHPAKLEVRLLEEERIAGLVCRVLKDALRVKAVIPSNRLDSKKELHSTWRPSQMVFRHRPGHPGEPETKLMSTITSLQNDPVDFAAATGAENHDSQVPTLPRESCGEMAAGEETATYRHGKTDFPSLKALAQFLPTYILAGGEDGLYIIDQHAAHERVLYEEYLKHPPEKPPVQCLLVPVTLELAYRDAAVLTERVLWFTDAGFVVEHFGGNTFLLRGVPVDDPAGQEAELFLDLLDFCKEKGAGATRAEFFDRLTFSLACRNAVKAGEKLSGPSMDALLCQLAQTENPFTCPHGRPTVIHLSYGDLAVRFKRNSP